MSTIKVDTVRPVTADASLTLQGDSSGSGVTGLTIDSSGVVNTTTAKVTNIQATSGQSLTIKDEDGNAAITIGTDNTAASYLSLNFGSYHGGSGALTGNTLDDYEEGTLEGTLTPTTSGSVTINTTINTLRYTKIGGLVHITGRLNVSSVSVPVGDYILGLPFSIASITEAGESGGLSTVWYNDSSSSLENGFLFTGGTGTDLRLRLGSTLAAGDNVYISYCYVTDS